MTRRQTLTGFDQVPQHFLQQPIFFGNRQLRQISGFKLLEVEVAQVHGLFFEGRECFMTMVNLSANLSRLCQTSAIW
jgi:hypothetical protein